MKKTMQKQEVWAEFRNRQTKERQYRKEKKLKMLRESALIFSNFKTKSR